MIRSTARVARRRQQETSRVLRLQSLEARVCLAGDLVANWTADDLSPSHADGAEVAAWTDSIAGVRARGTGGATLIKGAAGGRAAVRFDAADGADEFRVAQSDNPLADAADFSVVVVFATNSGDLVGSTDEWFTNTALVDASSQGLTQDWGLSLNSSGQLSTGLGDGFGLPSTTLYSTTAGLNDGQLHYVTVTRSGPTLSLYVDGDAVDERNDASVKNRTKNVELAFGRSQTRQFPYTGDIAAVRFYDGALDAAEISRVHDELIAYYGNQPPVAVDDAYSFAEDPLLSVVPADRGLLSNDTDADGDSLTAVVVDQPRHGSLGLRTDGSFFYDPQSDFFGTDSFTYTAVDFRPSNVATVTITVTNTYDPAQAMGDLYKLLPTEMFEVSADAGLLSNDLNPDQVALTAVLESDVGSGALSLRPDGSFVYDPEGFAGTTSFTYGVNDGTRLSESAEVTLIVNTPPSAADDQYDATEDSPLMTTAATGLLANDTDADNDPLTVAIVEGPAHGTVELQAGGSFVYTPDANYFGPDRFRYKNSDGVDDSGLATVNLNVSAVNDAPVAAPDGFFSVSGETIVRSAAGGVLANDADIDHQNLAAELVAEPNHGTVRLNADGSFSYAPNAGFTGTDVFSYKATDGVDESPVTAVELLIGTSPIVISELLAVNVASLSTRVRAAPEDTFSGEAEAYDWIELLNLTRAPLDIGGFHLSDRPNNRTLWQFPAATLVPAAGQLVVLASGLDIKDVSLDEQGLLHTNFRLPVEGEYLGLATPDGTILHEFDKFPHQFADISFGLDDAGRQRFFLESSPAEKNGATYGGVVSDVAISVAHGFFDAPFNVELTTSMPAAEIRYTLDGSAPTTANGTVYTGPLSISASTTLRTAAFRPGFIPSPSVTRTYLFLDEVLTQTRPDDLPDFVGRGIDFDVSQDIIDGQPEEQFIDALQSIPTLSIVSDLENLYGPEGFWVNGGEPGTNNQFEHPASVELIYPDGRGFEDFDGFQMNAGVQPHGTLTVKRSLQLEFKGRYGSSELRYPIFESAPLHAESATDSFKRVVLRAGNNMSWHVGHHETNFMRDQWVRDGQVAISGIGSRGTYVHLYLNGKYFGMFNMVEVPDHDFLASYQGGQPEDYFAVKAIVERNPRRIISGDRTRFDEMVARARSRDLEDAVKYAEFQRLLDVDKYIDYVALFWYVAHGDGLDNNWHGGMRNHPAGPYQFFVWDAEGALTTRQFGPPSNPTGWVPPDFRPRASNGTRIVRIWQALRENEEFMLRFADRVTELLSDRGTMSDDASLERLNALAEFIDDAVLGESARWGRGRTVSGDWIPNVELHRQRIRGNADILIADMRRYDYYPSLDAPRLQPSGGVVQRGSPVTIAADANAEIWYTLNSSDPRQPGGAVSAEAIRYAGTPIAIAGDTTVRARALRNGEWSAWTNEFFLVEQPADVDNLRITEINYHPHEALPQFGDAPLADSAFEFIEFQNVGQAAINLDGVELRQAIVDGGNEGVVFKFAPRTLAPGEHALVVANRSAFETRYGTGLPIVSGHDGIGGDDGQWGGGRLGNGGERITLVAANGDLIQQFDYDDGGPWPARADGVGATLEVIDPLGDDSDAGNWRASSEFGGSPGAAGVGPAVDVVINEVLSRSTLPTVDVIELYNMTSEAIDLSGWYVSDSQNNLFKFQISDATAIAAGGYQTFDQHELGFGFRGTAADDAWLIQSDANGKPIRFADRVRFGAADDGVAFGRWPNGVGDLFPQTRATPGEDNSGPVVGPVVMSEIHYHPADMPGEGMGLNGLEFVEVWNHTAEPLDISHWRLNRAVDLTFPQATILAADSGLVVVSFDPATEAGQSTMFRQAYGVDESVVLLGPYTGLLDNGGESVALERPVNRNDANTGHILVDRVDYDDDPPWPVEADGQGSSLQRLSATDFGSLPSSWLARGPSPGSTEFVTIDGDVNGDGQTNALDVDAVCSAVRIADPQFDLNNDNRADRSDFEFFVRFVLRTNFGDANVDGVFNSADLVSVSRTGEYEDGVQDNSTWADGDWNCDREFSSGDLVAAFRSGAFVAAGVPSATSRVDASELVAAIPDLARSSETSPRSRAVLKGLMFAADQESASETGAQMRDTLPAPHVELLFGTRDPIDLAEHRDGDTELPLKLLAGIL